LNSKHLRISARSEDDELTAEQSSAEKRAETVLLPDSTAVAKRDGGRNKKGKFSGQRRRNGVLEKIELGKTKGSELRCIRPWPLMRLQLLFAGGI
jgi:hypothetical protein